MSEFAERQVPGPPPIPRCSGCDIPGAGMGKVRHKPDCPAEARQRRILILESLIRTALNEFPLKTATWEAAKRIDDLAQGGR